MYDRATVRPNDRTTDDRTTVQGATEALYGLYPQFKCMTFIYLHSFIHHFKGLFGTKIMTSSQLTC